MSAYEGRGAAELHGSQATSKPVRAAPSHEYPLVCEPRSLAFWLLSNEARSLHLHGQLQLSPLCAHSRGCENLRGLNRGCQAAATTM